NRQFPRTAGTTGPRSAGTSEHRMKRLLSSCEGWILLALLGFLPLGPRPAAAAEVAAVVSQDLAPYQEALEGIQESLTQPLTVFNLATEPGGEQAVLDRLRE